MRQAPFFYNLISMGGLFFICLLAWLTGRNRRSVKWGAVVWGLCLQLLLGFMVFTIPAGRDGLLLVNKAVVGLLDHAKAGIDFVFGPLALSPGQKGPAGQPSLGFILAVQALPTIIFFMAFAALLYQTGIMQRALRLFSRVFVRTLGTSGAESMGVASNIFVGIESAGMVRPFFARFHALGILLHSYGLHGHGGQLGAGRLRNDP